MTSKDEIHFTNVDLVVDSTMSYIFPPRPKGAVPPHELPRFERQGNWCIQPKFKGARCVVTVSEDSTVECYGRHGRDFLVYSMPKSLRDEVLALRLTKGVRYVFDSELMIKTKAEDTKGKLILFDVLQQGKYFFYSLNQRQRLELLDQICGKPRKLDPWRGMAYTVSKNVLMAPVYFSNFSKEFEKELGEEVEGVVLRNLDSVIDNFGEKEYEVSWMIRCRKPAKHCNF